MKLEYKVKIKQNSDPSLNKTSLTRSVTSVKKGEGFEISSDLFRVGSNYSRSKELLASNKFYKGYLIGYEEKERISKNEEYLYSIEFPALITDIDMKRLRPYLFKITSTDLPFNIKEDHKFIILSYNEGVFDKIDESDYNLSGRTLIIDEIKFNTKDLFLVQIPPVYKYERNDSKYYMNKDEIIESSTGFYRIYPERVHKAFEKIEERSQVFIKTEQALLLKSNINISFEGLTSKEFICRPNSETKVRYSNQNLSSLIDYSLEDLLSKKFIIFQLIEDQYIPIYRLPLDIENPSFQELIESHSELKRPYYVVAEDAKVDIQQGEKILDSFVIYNTEFNLIYKNQSKGMNNV